MNKPLTGIPVEIQGDGRRRPLSEHTSRVYYFSSVLLVLLFCLQAADAYFRHHSVAGVVYPLCLATYGAGLLIRDLIRWRIQKSVRQDDN